MRTLRKPIYLTGGYNTISLGTGRKEFNPKKERPGLLHYLQEAGRGALAQVRDPEAVDEGVVSNFMAARFNRQGNLAGFLPTIHPALRFKPATRVEGACGSGGLGVATAIKAVLSDLADAVLVVGVEVQNSVKAIYGADYLAGAGYYEGERKEGHAYFFPSKFSDRAGAYLDLHGKERGRKGMARWYERAILNARRNPKAQEYHNQVEDLLARGLTPPSPRSFVEHLNVFDCSKVSDGASALIVASEEGLRRLGVDRAEAVVVRGFGQAEEDLTAPPPDLVRLTTTKEAASRAMAMAGVELSDLGLLELHDCFTITGLLALETLGVVGPGQAPDLLEEGRTRPDGDWPTNCTGGLIGFGHYTGGTGVRQAVDLAQQLLGRAGDCQASLKRRCGMFISMGGDDKTVVALVAEAP